MIIILGIVVGLLLLYLIRKAIHEYKEKKKIERWKSIWTSKRYSELFKKVPSKNDLNRVVSTQNFLTAGFSMPVDIFLSALVQYGFIECSRQSSFQMRYSYPTLYPQKAPVCCSADVPPILDKLLLRSVEQGVSEDVLLLFFALHALTEDAQSSVVLKNAAVYIQNCDFRIYDPIISEQRMKWNGIIKLLENSDSVHFSSAELDLFQISGRLSKDDFLCTNKSAVGVYDEVYLNGHVLRFYPCSHTYFVDGIRILSVTQMLKEIDISYANYAGVRPDVLNRAAAKGTALHGEIQNFEEHGTKGTTPEFQNYLMLKQKYGFTVETCEQYVIIYYQNIPVSAGRFDLLLQTSEKQTALADIKRTSTYRKDDVTKQLNLYRLGYIQTYDRPVDEIYCLRLRERVAQFRTVEVDDILTDNLIGRYVSGLRRDAKSYFELLQTDTPRQSFGKDGYHGHKNQHDYR